MAYSTNIKDYYRRSWGLGDRVGFFKGGKPLYKNVPDQPHIKQHPVSKKYLVSRSIMRDGKTTPQYKGSIKSLEEAIRIRDAFVEEIPAETWAETTRRTKTFSGKQDPKELNKAARWFYKRGEISSPNYIELPDLEKRKIRSNVAKGSTPGKFSKTTIFTPLKTSQQNKILKQFPDADFTIYKYGFSQEADKQSFDAVYDFVERGYKPAFHNIDQLPKKTQNLIEEAFGKQIADAGIDLKFGPGRKFGISPKENKQLYFMVQNFIQNTGKKYPYAFSFEKPENWIISQMHRASKHNPDVYKVLTNDAGKIIGASENGVEYYHANSKLGNTITNHPEAPKISKFVSVAKNAKANIPQSLMKMFPEGFDRNLLQGDRAYNDLLQWLDNSQGRRLTNNAINLHHAGAGGVRGNPALAKDLQLLTYQDNITAEVIKNQILNNDFSRVQELKDKGIRLNVGGKEYGAGVETAEQGLKRIETQAGTKLTERLKTDPKLKEFKKFLEQDIVKRFRDQGIKITNAQAGFITTELLGDIGRVGGKILKGAGVVGTAIEPAFAAMNFSEAIEAGLSGKEAGLYTVGKFGEDVVNIPGILIGAKNYLKDKFTGQGEKAGPFEYLPTKTKFETPYEVTFARDWKEKREDAIPENVKLRRAAEREFDNTIGANMRMVDETEIPASGEEIFTAKDTYLKSQLGENYEVTHPKDVEKEKKADGGLSGVDQYILNRYR